MSVINIEDRRYSNRVRKIGIKEIVRIAERKNYELRRLLVVMETLDLNQLKSVVKMIKDKENLFRSLTILKIKELEENRNMEKFLRFSKEDIAVLEVYKGKGFSIKPLPVIELQR